MSLILLTSCFTTPLDLAFPLNVENYVWYWAMCLSLDIMFLIDVLINCVSAFETEDFEIIDDRKTIFTTYATSWMSIDIMAIIPFDHMFDVGAGNGLIRVARIGKLYKLVKITRLVRLLKIVK